MNCKFKFKLTNGLLIIAILNAVAPIAAKSQTFLPRLSLAGGGQYTYQVNVADTIKQTINEKDIIFPSAYSATIKFVVPKVTANNLLNVAASYSNVSSVFQLRGRDTTLAVPGNKGSSKKYTYATSGKLLRQGLLVNDPQGITSNLENNFISCRIFSDIPATATIIGSKWITQQTDTIYSVALGGKIIVSSQTNLTYSTAKTIQNTTYAVIDYTAGVSLLGQNTMDGAVINITGQGNRTGQMLVDMQSGLIYSDRNTLTISISKAITGNMVMTIPINRQINYTIQREN